jgi:hypothetical protein
MHNCACCDLGEINRDIGNECEKKNDCRKNGYDEIESNTVRAIHDLVFIDVVEKNFQKLIEREIVMAFELYFF